MSTAPQQTTEPHAYVFEGTKAVPTATQRLWTELAAMVARARQQDHWHLILDGHAQDLEAAEAVLRETKAEVCP